MQMVPSCWLCMFDCVCVCVVNFMSQQVECAVKAARGVGMHEGEGQQHNATTPTPPADTQLEVFCLIFFSLFFFCPTRKTWDCFVVWVCVKAYVCVCKCVCVRVLSVFVFVLGNVLKNKWDIYFHCRLCWLSVLNIKSESTNITCKCSYFVLQHFQGDAAAWFPEIKYALLYYICIYIYILYKGFHLSTWDVAKLITRGE